MIWELFNKAHQNISVQIVFSPDLISTFDGLFAQLCKVLEIFLRNIFITTNCDHRLIKSHGQRIAFQQGIPFNRTTGNFFVGLVIDKFATLIVVHQIIVLGWEVYKHKSRILVIW
ncbi:hypothetical protein D3C87_1703090 [compost metagenome]